jgi:quercetin dioxygenase-like cupin family protein
LDPFGNILQLFRHEFTTSGHGEIMLRLSRRMTRHQTMEDIMSPKAVIRMPGEGKAVTLAGKPMTFLVTGDDTKHTSMFDWTLPAGFSTGLHVHRVQEETFYVLDGECRWQIGDETVRAKPGTYVFIPPGVPHNIGNASDRPARMIMTVSPPGHEHYFEELVKLVAKSNPPDANAIAELRNRYDTQQLSALKAS